MIVGNEIRWTDDRRDHARIEIRHARIRLGIGVDTAHPVADVRTDRRRRRPDDVAHDVVRQIHRAADRHAVADVAADDVGGNHVGEGVAVEIDASAAVADGERTRRVGADHVACDEHRAEIFAVDVDAVAGVAGNHVEIDRVRIECGEFRTEVLHERLDVGAVDGNLRKRLEQRIEAGRVHVAVDVRRRQRDAVAAVGQFDQASDVDADVVGKEVVTVAVRADRVAAAVADRDERNNRSVRTVRITQAHRTGVHETQARQRRAVARAVDVDRTGHDERRHHRRKRAVRYVDFRHRKRDRVRRQTRRAHERVPFLDSRAQTAVSGAVRTRAVAGIGVRRIRARVHDERCAPRHTRQRQAGDQDETHPALETRAPRRERR